MFLPPQQPSDINKNITDHLQLHSVLRVCSRASCVLAENSKSCACHRAGLDAARCSGQYL